MHYIGQTGRSFQDRYKEHIRAITTNAHSNFAEHIIDKNHKYSDMENDLEILHICNKGTSMTTLENYEIYKSTKFNQHLLFNEKLTNTNNPLFDILLTLQN